MLNRIIFDIQALNLSSIAPMILLIFFALGILCISMVKKELSNRFYLSLTIVGLILNFITISSPLANFRGMFNIVLMDGIAVFSIILIIATSIFFMALKFEDNYSSETSKPEFYSLFLFMLVGYEFMVSSDNLILIIIGLELSSLALYTLIALKNTKYSVEAALKYFVMGSVGSGFFIFGCAILYLVTGSVEMHTIYSAISEAKMKSNLTLYAGTIFIVVAIGFKVSLVPFHTWLPDVYEGASTPLAAYISIVPKIAAFVIGLRIFDSFLLAGIDWISNVLYIIIVLTMTLANITALVQKSVKRMLAFSSISNAGFAMAAILVGTTQATMSLFLYWIMFAIANLGAFSVVWVMENVNNEKSKVKFENFSGLIKEQPLLALIMAIFMFSLAGIPPFSLFWGKIYIIGSILSVEYNILAVIMVLNSAIAVYYYLKIVVYMFLKEPLEKIEISIKLVRFVLILTALLSIFAPIVVEYIFSTLKLSSMIIISGY
ncbi:NADH:quinone oxidoreductase I, membrane subunit N [Campylobacter blaseri]|uniref:NADH-quinone oxidoreductase subunit N n=1 Tax=Campylobacter blaseri TaxID=2042961 RepID=A0A2P8R0Z4_9BACT|nr:NADH-quinone oxidoreductase subunit NuoN [Campylobacter blaseri]PSM52172.1 NADH-quinone oxidoreductase subunit NuoN [Campylobacter blaseri]PSM53938.1 NADH-quinone oxidoreductase subunit NuoN [Campylobacter blaseri]QKF85374.1 NADH:quinone oxidoreductase I, membrane subunit N [Campylobacter blaseri]